MRPLATTLAVALSIFGAACIENTAPGNDREAALDPPPRPADMVSADSAISGVEVALLHPEIMTEADLATVAAGCRFRFTRIGYPAFVYSLPAAQPGIIKLNGKLVAVEPGGSGRFASGSVTVELRPVDADAGEAGQQATDLILTLPGAPVELGYRGFSECDG